MIWSDEWYIFNEVYFYFVQLIDEFTCQNVSMKFKFKNLLYCLYFQIKFTIMAKVETSRSGRTLRKTEKLAYDPGTHTTNIAKTMKCKVTNLYVILAKIL